MSTEMVEVLKLLTPSGAVAIILGILAYRSPLLVRELFAGVNGLLLTIQKMRKDRIERRPGSRT